VSQAATDVSSKPPAAPAADIQTGGFALPAAPPQAVLSPQQFQKIESLQRSIGKLSRRLTSMVLLNLIILGLFGWSWYNDHQKLVDGWIARVQAKISTPATPALPAAPAPKTVAPKAPSETFAPAVRNPQNAAAAQKLFNEAKKLERDGMFPDALDKLEKIQFTYPDVDWPAGLTEALARLNEKKSEASQSGFFGVH
jgi:hypothetical protein